MYYFTLQKIPKEVIPRDNHSPVYRQSQPLNSRTSLAQRVYPPNLHPPTKSKCLPSHPKTRQHTFYLFNWPSKKKRIRIFMVYRRLTYPNSDLNIVRLCRSPANQHLRFGGWSTCNNLSRFFSGHGIDMGKLASL